MNWATIEGVWDSSQVERDRIRGDGRFFLRGASGLSAVPAAKSSRPPKAPGLSSEPGIGDPIPRICSLRWRPQGDGEVKVIPGGASGVLGPSLDNGEEPETRPRGRAKIGGGVVLTVLVGY